MTKTLLITGATGQQGGATIDALLDHNPSDFEILAVTRNASSPAAKRLAARSASIKLVEGNLDDVPALLQAAREATSHPIFGVFSVQISLGTGVTMATEVAQGKALIDGAIKAGVEHFVYTSVERGGDQASWDNPTPIPHFQSKHQIELHLKENTAPGAAGANMGWTILRPVAFMENLAPGFQTGVFMAALRNNLKEKPLQWVSTSDIGIFAAKVFADPKKWNRRAVGLAGDELNMDQMNESFKKATGRPAPESFWILGSVLTYLAHEMGVMIRWFASDGYRADIRARRKEHSGLLTVEEWIKKKSNFDTVEESLT